MDSSKKVLKAFRLSNVPSELCILNLASNSSIKAVPSLMPEQPPSDRQTSDRPPDRFKAEMPQIPGVTAPLARPPVRRGPIIKLALAILAVLVVAFLGVRWALRPHHKESRSGEQPQIDVPAPAPDPSALVPHANDANPAIANLNEMAKPWSSRSFSFATASPAKRFPESSSACRAAPPREPAVTGLFP
jgi:hypothetical protein